MGDQMTAKVEVPKYKVVDSVELDPRRTAVVIVDMQNDFAHPNGRLYSEAARKIIPAIERLLSVARDSGATVVYTQDAHVRGDVEFNIWGEHAVEGTWGYEIVDELKPQEGEYIVRKLRYDAFFGTPLDHILRSQGIEWLVIVGTVANICVLHTAASAALHLYKIVVPVDGIAALTEFDMHATLRQIDFLYRGVIVRSVDGIRFKSGG